MRKFIYVLIAMIAIPLAMSCERNTILPENEYPAEIVAFVQTHFSGANIVKLVRERDGAEVKYEVRLSSGVKLEFNSDKRVIEIESYTKLPDSVIPAKILDYVQKNYPNAFIVSWELERNKQSVKLNSGIELEFDLAGNFLRIDG